MSKENNVNKQEFTLAEKAFDLFVNEEIDISLEDITRLIELAPNVKDMFSKAVDANFGSSKDIFDLLRNIIEIYKDELKREDLSQEQREKIYDRIDQHAKDAHQHDDNNKKFINGLTGVALTAVVGTVIKFGPQIIRSVIKK
ncbi:hypothetical protein CSV80_13445 [Sporosarcina sp. P12(2017)]|uniref:hypothetical protein n=1 Tax=unclassified Sporosarcina TaxID=2647733 RepID=UPI000C1632F9|nr:MULTISPECIES: hypothetical protein [unclassified Sporosarcina]PIC56675.1 hypothetical protein CSV81_12880 [Sporosarcina sp. P10]PIC59892.1 hypothetical protein CSV80_13445 [Sporosarcina sp. P12(2017)]